MGTRAICQKGRGKIGLVLPADALKTVNEVSDRSTIVKWHGKRQANATASVDEPSPTPPIPSTQVVEKTVTATVACPVADTRVQTACVEVSTTESSLPIDAPPQAVGSATVTSRSILTVESENRASEKKAVKFHDDLTTITGIGPVLQERLANLDITTFEALARADIERLNALQGSKGRAAEWVLEARRRVPWFDSNE